MPIIVKNGQFHLCNDHISYVINMFDDRYLLHSYFGKRISTDLDFSVENNPSYAGANGAATVLTMIAKADDHNTYYDKKYYFGLSTRRLEFLPAASGDYRAPMFAAEYADGSLTSEFTYCGYEIIDGKPCLEGLPATYTESDQEAQTLRITLKDNLKGLKAVLSYTVFEAFDAIAKSICYINEGTEPVRITTANSFALDLYGLDYKVYHLCGHWCRERKRECIPVSQHEIRLSNNRVIQNHAENPFAAIAERDATEDYGSVYGVSLVYSGEFAISVEGTNFGITHITGGINDDLFAWDLKPNETFTTPEAVLAYSSQGLNKMSQTYHTLYRTRLCRGKYRDAARPILTNVWEAVYTDFDEEKLLKIAKKSADIGLDLFVVDDGWYSSADIGKECNVGDWYADKGKLPGGLRGLAEKVNALGLKFGLWMEPEMVGYDSKVYKEHPDWVIHVPGRKRMINHGRLVLDLSKDEVVKHITDTFDRLLSEANIAYIKWDCNRSVIERASSTQAHRYILGLYRILEHLHTKHPDLLLENCSAGGGRTDPGIMYYMPQSQISDNTHATDKIWMTYGGSLVYPMSFISSKIGSDDYTDGKAELAAAVGMTGIFGFECDLSTADDTQVSRFRELVADYRRIQPIIQNGTFYRLCDPFENDHAAWMYVTEDKRKAMLFVYRTKRAGCVYNEFLKLKGLDADLVYHLRIRTDMVYMKNEVSLSGALLESTGVQIGGSGKDFSYAVIELTAIGN